MIGKQELESTIKRAMERRSLNDAEVLRELGYSAEAVEELGYNLGARMLRQGVSTLDAIAAAFASGLEVGVRLERERRDA